MAKKEIGQIKLQIPGGDAKPAPPVGPALGQLGVPIMPFCKEFNAKTQQDAGLIIPVIISVYADRTFSFITKTPPAAVLLLRAANLKKGSGTPNLVKVGKVTEAQVRDGHPNNGDNLAGLAAVLDAVEEQAPDFSRLVLTGDIAQDEQAETYGLLRDQLARRGWLVPGRLAVLAACPWAW